MKTRFQVIEPYLYITPYFVVFILFLVLPAISGMVIGFYDWPVVGDKRYLGLGNFQELFGDPMFINLGVDLDWPIIPNPMSLTAFVDVGAMLPYFKADGSGAYSGIKAGLATRAIWTEDPQMPIRFRPRPEALVAERGGVPGGCTGGTEQ